MKDQIVDTGKSYTGDFIESWCKLNLFNNRNAFQLLYDYWCRKNNCFPNKNSYYFVETHLDGFHNTIWKLRKEKPLEESEKVVC